ncbi:MAG: carbon-nitrogen hydrolase family protein [Flavobacteriaceae bacterium]
MKILKVALAQISPVWLNKKKTLDKVKTAMLQASKEKAELVVFGEGLLPGYPFWLALTNGAQWDLKINKVLHAHYVQNSINIENGDLDEVCSLANQYKMAVYIGVIERASNRGGHSLYCSLVFINDQGVICSVHRKLQPTYDERLTWSPGDGNGLQVHSHKGFTLGGLNCWENWMPLPRAALYGMGENVHCAVWPGSDHNTKDITRFIARESRSYVISVSALMTKSDFPENTPYFEELLAAAPDNLANGGSCVANPDGSWLIEPIINSEGVFCTEIYLNRIYEERQNFDPSGHYSRPDVTQLHLNRERQSTLKIND